VGERLENLEIESADILKSIRVCLYYFHSWIRGIGAMALEGLMEDKATVEICRIQLWIWTHYNIMISDLKKKLTIELFNELVLQEFAKLKLPDRVNQYNAKMLLKQLTKSPELPDCFMQMGTHLLNK
jgi:malate synthase